MSIVQLKEQLLTEVEAWGEHHDLYLPYDTAIDLVDALIDSLRGTILEIRNLPTTTENDEEHYND